MHSAVGAGLACAAVVLALGAYQDAERPRAPSMTVSQEQFASALGICRDQLADVVSAGDKLAAAGWPKVASQASDGKAPAMRTYRHPENMLLLTLYDSPAAPDQCIVMAPTGPTLDAARASASISSITGTRPSRDARTSWRTDAADIQLEQTANIAVRVIFTQKEPK